MTIINFSNRVLILSINIEFIDTSLSYKKIIIDLNEINNLGYK